MRAYENKEELKAEINRTFKKYIAEFDDIPEGLKDKKVDEVDRTPAENLAYQVGWTTLVLKWETDERNGLPVKTPSDQFKWNQLGELYSWFTDTYAHLSLQELRSKLSDNINSLYEMIDAFSDAELFRPHMRKWTDDATRTAVWEVYKFIHVNTVAPFQTFRTKIRRWKKLALQKKQGSIMSKYDSLWKYIQSQDEPELTLTFDSIGRIAGVPLDHSFLNYKKELLEYGWKVGKISLKKQTVLFQRISGKEQEK